MKAGHNNWRWLVAVLWVMALAAPVFADSAQDLDKAARLYKEHQYQESQELLLQVDADQLNAQQKQQRDELAEALRTAINQANKAKQNLEDAEKALAAGTRDTAEKSFKAVQDNEYASAAQKQKAREGLATLAKQRDLDRKVAAQSAETKPAGAPATKPADAAPANTGDGIKTANGAGKAQSDRNRALALEAIRDGDAAGKKGQWDLAASKFEEALQLWPNNADAQKGLALVRQQRGAEGGAGKDLLDEAVKRRQGRWERTETLFRDSEKEIKQFINEHKYVEARERLDKAARLLEAGRRDAESPDRYAALDSRAKALGRFIEQEKKAFDEEDAAAKRRIAMDKERDRTTSIRKEKDERIAQLMDQVMELQKQRQYHQASDVLKEIIAIDPSYQNAEFMLRVVQDNAIVQDQTKGRRRYLSKFQETFQQAEIQLEPTTAAKDNKWVVYPDENEWRVIANRDPFGADLSLTGETERDKYAREQLDTLIPELEFAEGTTFEDAITQLKKIGKIDIIPNWKVLEVYAIDKTNVVGGVSYRNGSLKGIISDLLDKLGGAEAVLGFDIIEGQVRISTEEHLAKNMETRVYDVGDLLADVPSFAANSGTNGGMMGGMGMMGGGMGMGGGGGMGMGGGGGGGYGGSGSSGSGSGGDDDDASTEGGRRRREQDLKNLIIKHVKGAWSEADAQSSGSGSGRGESTQAVNPEELEGKGRITIEGDRMVMTQTPAAHREVIRMFKLLRKFKDVQVAVEARFVTLRSNFLEEIGVDLDVILNQGHAGLDTAMTTAGTGTTGTGTSSAAIDPLTGAVLVMPRNMTSLGITPLIPAAGQAMGQTTLAQPYNNVALVPTGSPNSWWDRHTTPVPLMNNSVGLAGARTTSVPGNLSSVVNSTKPAFSMAGTFLDNLQVDFLLKATQMDARGSSVDAPRLVCFNARQATIQVQTMVGYVVSPGYAPTNGNLNNSGSPGGNTNTSYVPKGRMFTVKPFVSADRKYVTLVVQPQVTDVTFKRIPTYAGALATYFEVPEMQVTQIMTGVKVPDGGTVLLGGLTLAAEEEVEAGVPIVSKIPILKRAFTNRSRVKDEFVLLVLIKPTIIFQDEQEEKAFPNMMTTSTDARLGAS